jgi:hypothetical protein
MDELTMLTAFTLISEKVRFWSDSQLGLSGETLAPRCMNPDRLVELHQSLLEIKQICKKMQEGRQ